MGGYWKQAESCFREDSVVELSHGLCPQCLTKPYPAYAGRMTRGAEKT